MTNTPHARHRIAALTAAVLLALTGSACAWQNTAPDSSPTSGPVTPRVPITVPSAQPLPPGRAGTPPVPLPQPTAVRGDDPDAVSAAALIVMWTIDTAIDTSQYQAELRAAPFLTPTYTTRLRQHPPRSAPGTEWNIWAAHRAYTVVRLLPARDDPPPDTATLARRQWGLTATPVGRDGWTGQSVAVTAFLTLTRFDAGQPWRVGAVTVSS